MRLAALLVALLAAVGCGSQSATQKPVTVTVTKTAPPAAPAKPTRADRLAIKRAIQAEACPKGHKCVISPIRFAKSDPSYASAGVYDPKTNPGLAVLHRKGSRWVLVDLGTFDSGCETTPRRVHRELRLYCSGEEPQQAAAPPAPQATSAALADPYNGHPGDKHFAVYYLQLKDDGLGDIGGIARVKNVGSSSLTGSFTFTLFQSGRIVGTAQGSAQGVSPGQTVTVQLVSQDKMFYGRYRYQFQVDTEF